jgi:hypothetical protein
VVRPSSRESMGPTYHLVSFPFECLRCAACNHSIATRLSASITASKQLVYERTRRALEGRRGHVFCILAHSAPLLLPPPSSLLGPSTRSPGRRAVPEGTSTISIARRPTPANPGELPASKQQPSLHVLPPTSHVPAQRRYPPVSSAQWPCTPCIPRLGPVDDSDPSPPATCIRIPPQMAPEYPRRGHACAQDGGQD